MIYRYAKNPRKTAYKVTLQMRDLKVCLPLYDTLVQFFVIVSKRTLLENNNKKLNQCIGLPAIIISQFYEHLAMVLFTGGAWLI